MSGGHYNYKYQQINQLIDDIESDFIEDGKYLSEDWSIDIHKAPYWGKRPMITLDRIEDATEEERPIILAEIRGLINDLKVCSERARALEWYMSHDSSAASYLKALTKIKNPF